MPIDVLFLCTGNLCRSPMAEVLLRARLADHPVVRVRSAGVLDLDRPATPLNVEVMGARGHDLSSHRSHQVRIEDLRAADLVIGMTREHVREVAVLLPEAWPRTFTLKELVRRATEVGPRSPGQPLDEWVAKVHAGRTTAALLGESPDDDVADPIGQPRRVYEAAADEIGALIDQLADLAWGLH